MTSVKLRNIKMQKRRVCVKCVSDMLAIFYILICNFMLIKPSQGSFPLK